MNDKVARLAKSIQFAREKGVGDDIIMKEVERQNPGYTDFFKKEREEGKSCSEILDDLMNGDGEREGPLNGDDGDVLPPPPPPPVITTSTASTTEEKEQPLAEPSQKKKTKSAGSKKKKVFALVALMILIVTVIVFSLVMSSPIDLEVTEEQLSQWQFSSRNIATTIEPSVVRIALTVTGEFIIPVLAIDRDLKVIERDNDFMSIIRLDDFLGIDAYFTEGSGFIVTPDGYVVTNAHVVSTDALKDEIAFSVLEYIILALDEDFLRGDISEFAFTEMKKKISEEVQKGEDSIVIREMINDIISRISFNFKETVVVYNPSSSSGTMTGLFAESFSAQVVAVEPDWIYNNKDLAMIKINQDNLPAANIRSGGSSGVTSGDSAYLFGFPVGSTSMDATQAYEMIEINTPSRIFVPNIRIREGYLRPSFTAGKVTARKASSSDFDYIEIDAKAAPGSSGSALFSESGEVIAVLAVGTSSHYREKGDGFARAVPIEIALESSVIPENFQRSSYFYHARRGVYFLENKHCKKALIEFNLAKERVNASFNTAKSIDLFINECENMIEGGLSIDTRWDKFINSLVN